MARMKQSVIIEHFKETFVKEVMTDSEYKQWYKMQAIKLKNLRKVVANYIEESKIKTDKSVDEIIMDAITYGGMMGCKWNTIASVGYKMLPKSIEYWQRMELKVKKMEEEAKKKAKRQSGEGELELSDLIASLAIGSNTYNMSNVWDLTYYAFQD